MYQISLTNEEDFEGWRSAARSLAMAQVPASEVHWRIGEGPGDLGRGEHAQGRVVIRIEAPRLGRGFHQPRLAID